VRCHSVSSALSGAFRKFHNHGSFHDRSVPFFWIPGSRADARAPE